IHENPLIGAYINERRTETLKITDLIAPKNFERTAIYNEFYRRVGVSNQLVAPMQISDELFMACSINIENSDFSERDKEVLTLIAPHLANAIRNAFAYQRLSAALDTEACGIVALNSKGKPVFISDFARMIFGKYYADE
ncbi:MAG: GAF domain-containing protein, partial [Pyrinomonadaceae bacterium]|nr:GAF domain-containing protein [Pyrinomonadaceae bacterium]